MSLAPNHSAIWSSLFTLDTIRPFTTAKQDPALSYHPLTDEILPDQKQLILNRRHTKLATAVAWIGASSPESKTVTACSSEVKFPKDNEPPVITLRIAQNQPITDAEMENFRGLLKVLIEEIQKCNADEWNVKESTFSTSMCSFVSCDPSPWRLFIDRHIRIESIVEDVLLPRVVTRCRTKISAILVEFYSKPFRAWYEKKSSAYLDSVPPANREAISDYFEVVNMALEDNQKNEEDICFAIAAAHRIISAGVTSNDFYEEQWTKHDPPILLCDEIIDDHETLDDADVRKSIIHRFLHKLARYYSSCHIIVREMVALYRSGHSLDIPILTVPILKTTSSPRLENEYGNLDSFLNRCIGVDRKALDSRKVDKVANKWGANMAKDNLILHAEMQLALFYATHPQSFPIQGYIGVSKKCCWGCHFVFK
jgi:hypothetical protein